MDWRTADKTSRRIDRKTDSGTKGIDSNRTRSDSTLTVRRLTNIPSRHSRGGLYRPVLQSGPFALQDEYSIIVSWILDPSEEPGYHRVRYRLIGAEDWIVTDWTGSPSYSAEITIPGLAVGIYEYQVESSAGVGGLWTMGFVPTPTATFEIKSLFELIISNNAWTIGKTTLTIRYDTNAATKCIISYKKSSEPLWQQANFTGSFHTGGHSHLLTGLTTATEYWIRIEAYDAAGNHDWSPSETGYFRVKTHSSTGTGGGYIRTVT